MFFSASILYTILHNLSTLYWIISKSYVNSMFYVKFQKNKRVQLTLSFYENISMFYLFENIFLNILKSLFFFWWISLWWKFSKFLSKELIQYHRNSFVICNIIVLNFLASAPSINANSNTTIDLSGFYIYESILQLFNISLSYILRK